MTQGQETVTQDQMGQAMNKMGIGLLKMLGITPTAEMGQTPWLPTSPDAELEPIIDVDKMADLLHGLEHNQEQIVAKMGQLGHGPGLCDETLKCPPCRDQRRVFATKIAPQIEKAALAQAGSKIDRACEWAKVPELRDQISRVMEAYDLAGSPGFEDADFEIIIEGVGDGQH